MKVRLDLSTIRYIQSRLQYAEIGGEIIGLDCPQDLLDDIDQAVSRAIEIDRLEKKRRDHGVVQRTVI